ncbi:MAG: HPP family protein [Thiohalocapsa sp.]|jgi:CBS-domain-containing membrane protein|uniref:HPP family protein n=1 Tax=Thiohalocapsa sp. TaxID=2497641 RepID=UPI0025F1930B|nr:HPP family protein [Thiohalocapsa sp.]MCG6939812.1 HPP family protein [Thiohalocapsa sp.]
MKLPAISRDPTGHLERWLSMAGGLLGIALIYWTSALLAPASATVLVVASMGASAVLVFGVPHGPLSQPWPVLGGHVLSGLIGVTVAQQVHPVALAAPLAVGLAILVMHYTRSLHPPGGATALTAVLSSSAATPIGYAFVLTPVLLNAVVIVTVGTLFNFPFAWRRYPAVLAARTEPKDTPADAEVEGLAEDDLLFALRQMGSFIDASEHDLLRIYTLATRHADRDTLSPADIQPGRCYSNGRFGADWSVRCVVDAADKPANDLVIYRGVAGAERRCTGTMSRAELARWARYEVQRDETTWRPVHRDDNSAGQPQSR